MKNPLLSNLSFFDKLFPLAQSMPRPLRRSYGKLLAPLMNRRLKQRGLPDRLTLFVTARCNLRCAHCFIVPSPLENEWEMGIDEYARFFENARGLFSQVLFTGGEPTLRNDLPEIVTLANRRGGVGAMTIFTNGINSNRILDQAERVMAATDTRLSFQLSIDGAEEYHDTFRGVGGALGKTLNTMRALTALKQKYPDRIDRLAATTSITKSNVETLPTLIDTVAETGYLHSFTFVRTSESVENLAEGENISNFAPKGFNDYIDYEGMRRAMDILREKVWKPQADSLYYNTNRVMLESVTDYIATKQAQTSCKAGLADITLLPNGTLARCEMLEPFADLKEYDWDISRLLRDESSQSYFKRTANCWCAHDCAIGVSIMYDDRLMSRLFDGAPGDE